MRTVFHVSTAGQFSYVDAKVRNLLADETVAVDRVAVVVDSPGAIDAAAGPAGRRRRSWRKAATSWSARTPHGGRRGSVASRTASSRFPPASAN